MILDVQTVKDYLQIQGTGDDDRIQLAARQAEASAAKYCGRDQFESKWYVRTEDMGRWRSSIVVPVRPVVANVCVSFGDDGFSFMGSDATTGTPGEITFTDHDLATGDGPFRLIGKSDAEIPSGLAVGIDYYAIAVDADTIRLALTAADAEAGTAVSITDAPLGKLTRLVGPFISPRDVVLDPFPGIIRLRVGTLWPSTPVTVVWRAGLCENGDDAPDDLIGALCEQAAYRFRQGGINGRLGLVQADKPAGVVDHYTTTEWAPGVRAILENYKVRNL